MTPAESGDVIELTPALLAQWPLPLSQSDGDKESRGQVLVIAGSREMPGAAMLAASSALRAGAGKLVVATPASVAAGIALSVPEARVMAMPETQAGGFDARGAALLEECARTASAVLIGPGMIDAESCIAFLRRALPMFASVTTVLDALAMDVVCDGGALAQPVLLTPHAGEMAHLRNHGKDEVVQDPVRIAREAATAWRAVVMLKGACTCIAAPDGRVWRHHAHIPGLGTSGSGDVLAGLAAGFAARGAPAEQAGAWAVALHARIGDVLARRLGAVGYLARELVDESAPVLKTMAGSHA
jgi:hydroxyethylthiazole kinase-like uncharacterized protein yjeF